MNKCVDKTGLDGYEDVTDLCKRLPPTGSGECISIKDYTGENFFGVWKKEPTSISELVSVLDLGAEGYRFEPKDFCHRFFVEEKSSFVVPRIRTGPLHSLLVKDS